MEKDSILYSSNNPMDAPSLSNLVIDLKKIEYNIALFKQHLPTNTRIMAMIKANAYGTNAITIAKYLKEIGISYFGVAHIEEGILLRKHGIVDSIFVTHVPHFQLEEAVYWNLEIAIDGQKSFEILNNQPLKVNAHINLNTGMSRFGCTSKEALLLSRQIQNSCNINLIGIMSHFHSSDIHSSDEISMEQVRLLDDTICQIEKLGVKLQWKHLPNTSAAARFHLPQYNLARIGQGLFGIHLTKECERALPLSLALSLESCIVDVRTYPEGTTVSYGQSYTVKSKAERIAAVAIGYHDGIHRTYANRAYCLVRGKMAPFVGNICMDYLLINVTEIEGVSVGDTVTFFGTDKYGNEILPREFAAYGCTISHELISCLGPRINRVFKAASKLDCCNV